MVPITMARKIYVLRLREVPNMALVRFRGTKEMRSEIKSGISIHQSVKKRRKHPESGKFPVLEPFFTAPGNRFSGESKKLKRKWYRKSG
jgi:hypothetical protein